MNNEVAKTQGEVETQSAIQLATEYLSAMGAKISPQHQAMFLHMAQAFGLNPFKREIYCIPYGDRVGIVTGYETYIKRAERSGKLDGWEIKIEGKASDKSLRATITIHRKDWTYPFTHTVYYLEVGGNSAIWQKQPVFMTKKVAISQGFRLCFPDELGGMPYTADEMDTVIRDITPQPDELPTAGAASASQSTAKQSTAVQGELSGDGDVWEHGRE